MTHTQSKSRRPKVKDPVAGVPRAIQFVLRASEPDDPQRNELLGTMMDDLRGVWGDAAGWATTVGQELFKNDPLELKPPDKKGRRWLAPYPKDTLSDVMKRCTHLGASLFPGLNPLEKDNIKRIVFQKYTGKTRHNISWRDAAMNPELLRRAGRERTPALFQFSAPYPLPLRMKQIRKLAWASEKRAKLEIRIGQAGWKTYYIEPSNRDFMGRKLLQGILDGSITLADGGHAILHNRKRGAMLKLVYRKVTPPGQSEKTSGTLMLRSGPGALVIASWQGADWNERPPWTGIQLKQLYRTQQRRRQGFSDDRKAGLRTEGMDAASTRRSENFENARKTRMRQIAASVADRCFRMRAETVVWDDSDRRTWPEGFAWEAFASALACAFDRYSQRGMAFMTKSDWVETNQARRDFAKRLAEFEATGKRMIQQQENYLKGATDDGRDD